MNRSHRPPSILDDENRRPNMQPTPLSAARLLLVALFSIAIFVPSIALARGPHDTPQLPAEPDSADIADIAMAQPAAIAMQTSLLTNADFLDQTGWANCSGANDTNWDANENHLRILGTGPACIFQTVEGAPGQRYELSCVSYEEAAQPSRIRLSALDLNWQTVDEADVAVRPGSSITELELIAPTESAHIAVTFDSPGVGYSSYDRCDLSATEADPAPPSEDPGENGSSEGNLLNNGDFADDAGWNSCGDAAGYVIAGGQLRVESNPSSPACIYQEIGIDAGGTYQLTCSSSVMSGYTSTTLSALNANYAALESALTEETTLGQPMTVTTPPGTAFLSATIYGEGISTHDNCVLEGTDTTPSPQSVVTVSADDFYGNGRPSYAWSSLAPGTTVKLIGNFQSGITLDATHSGLVFDGGHVRGGADGWLGGAVLNGSGFVTPDYHDGAIQINGASDITVQNFKIGNYESRSNLSDPKAIFVLGDASNVVIQNNEIFGFTASHLGACHTTVDRLIPCGSAHGILVSTEGPIPSTMRDIGIYNNLIYEMDLGKSEALTVKGDVRGFSVNYNTVHDVNNIGIDVAGYVDDTRGIFYSTQDGLVEGNTVYNVDTRGDQDGYVIGVGPNQAYVNIDNNDYPNQSAACIYVDGGQSVQVVANRVSRCNIGISINGELSSDSTTGSESAKNVIIEGNLVYDSSTTGFKLGSGNSAAAGVEGCDVRNNLFYSNDAVNPEFGSVNADLDDQFHDGIGEIWVEHSVRSCKIRDNTFLANSTRTDAPDGLRQTVFATTITAPTAETAVYTNNRFYYEGQSSVEQARCQWVGFSNDSMTDCISALNSNGGSGNVYSPILRPDPLNLPRQRSY